MPLNSLIYPLRLTSPSTRHAQIPPPYRCFAIKALTNPFHPSYFESNTLTHKLSSRAKSAHLHLASDASLKKTTFLIPGPMIFRTTNSIPTHPTLSFIPRHPQRKFLCIEIIFLGTQYGSLKKEEIIFLGTQYGSLKKEKKKRG
ncbi:hypothetical protein AAZX31_15G198600 [Glycine max]